MKEDYQKALKKLTLFFPSNPVPFNEQNYQKQKGPGTSDQLLFRLGNKFRKTPLLVTYYLQVWRCNIKRFLELFQKLHLQNYASQFMTSKIIPLPFIFLNLENVEREGKNYKNLNILRTERAFSMKLKTFSIVLKGYHLVKK